VYGLDIVTFWSIPEEERRNLRERIEVVWKEYQGLKTSEIFSTYSKLSIKRKLPLVTKKWVTTTLNWLKKRGIVHKGWRKRGSFAKWKIDFNISLEWWFPGRLILIAEPPAVAERTYDIAIKRQYLPKYWCDWENWYQIWKGNLRRLVVKDPTFWGELREALEAVEKMQAQASISIDEANKIGYRKVLSAENFGFVECKTEGEEKSSVKSIVGFKLHDDWLSIVQTIDKEIHKISEIVKKIIPHV
jgi:hypothetical protein